jgi:hypothetical protein
MILSGDLDDRGRHVPWNAGEGGRLPFERAAQLVVGHDAGLGGLRRHDQEIAVDQHERAGSLVGERPQFLARRQIEDAQGVAHLLVAAQHIHFPAREAGPPKPTAIGSVQSTFGPPWGQVRKSPFCSEVWFLRRP